MADIQDLERKILKAVGEAETALTGLEKDIGPIIQKLNRAEIDTEKCEKAMKKVLAMMGKFAAVTKIQSSKAFDLLSPAGQARVVWMDGLMTTLLARAERLSDAKRMAKLDPAKKLTYLVKASKELQREARSAPKGVGTLLKMAEKGLDAKSPEGAMIAFLPMAILLWMIWHTISEGMRSRPR